MNDFVSLGRFVKEVMTSLYHNDNLTIENCFEYAFREKLIESNDFSLADNLINRRKAAMILHGAMQNVLGEKDLQKWESALSLKDIFDCHTCVNHIAQVYAKGIILVNDEMCFESDAYISEKEMSAIILRLVHSDQRVIPKNKTKVQWKSISKKDAQEILKKDAKALLIDVKSKVEYEKDHIPFSLNYPMMDILKNPYMITPQKNLTLILYCNLGYQSAIAANALTESGYESVYLLDLLQGD